MNKQKTQSGFSNLMIITIVLAVALIGTLGYVFWQNFMQSKATKVSNATTTSKTASVSTQNTPTTTTPSTTATDSNAGYLVLSDWGVKFKLPTSLSNDSITYAKESSGIYDFSTKSVEALGGSCTDRINFYLGKLIRLKSPAPSSDISPPVAAIIDGYYYYVVGAQSSCSENGLNTQTQDRATVVNLLDGVEKI